MTASAARPRVVLRCEHCGALFSRRADQRSRSKSGAVWCNKCSRVQRNLGREMPTLRTGWEVTCAACGKVFYRSASRLQAKNPVCSRVCAGTFAKGTERPDLAGKSVNAGAKNGRFQHGKAVGRNVDTVARRRVRAEVAERDGNWCLLCGKPGPGLHLHRVIYGSQGGKYETTNCVQLCAVHHTTVHKSKRGWKTPLVEYLADPTADRRVALSQAAGFTYLGGAA